ncbi:TetR/AcrR family transcriptional regulator [Actinocorallia longicatena]|uniref:TetR/AcrR family transcriptional regulator n=1 Tax=Actinocorallia longicatena TaxID=111803 RepID=A0ABP6Q0M9_9ACTN
MTLGRRERVRAATIVEITETARKILIDEGPEAVTLRAIAREMGMTAPALYRYFPSHAELVRHMVGTLFNELTIALHTEIKAVPHADMRGKFLAATLTFRRWALEHRREYALLFGTPFPGIEDVYTDDFAAECGRQFGLTFLHLFEELWAGNPFPVPPEESLDPRLRVQLARYRDSVGTALPLGCMQFFLQCWVRLQGAVSLEVFGHLAFAFDDPEPLFLLMLEEVATHIGLAKP